MGALLGVIFGASSLYLVLKVGLTVSASIPVAVISITLFRLLQRLGIAKASILQNNIVQTAGSAGESIAFGLGVTMPAIMILGFDMEIARVMLVAVLGGLLGILMMIPLRRALIVEQHGDPEIPGGHGLRRGAEGRRDPRGARDRPGGQRRRRPRRRWRTAPGPSSRASASACVYKLGEGRLQALEGHAGEDLRRAAGQGLDRRGDLAGAAGRRLHHRPADRRHHGRRRGAGLHGADPGDPVLRLGAPPAIIPPGKTLISAMSPGDIRSAYILYIGAGAVTAGGLISLARAMPTIWRGLKAGLADFGVERDGGARRRGGPAHRPGPLDEVGGAGRRGAGRRRS